MDEEVLELYTATTEAEELDALADIIFVCWATALMCGWNIDEAMRRVCEANLAKELGSNAKRPGGLDLIKPDGWQSPCHDDLVKES